MTALEEASRISLPAASLVSFVPYGTNSIHPAKAYAWIYDCYRVLNNGLFGGKLPNCLLTFQRTFQAYGYFSGDRFAMVGNTAELTDEIALNPAHFARPSTEVISTLLHEMVHLEQHHFGNPGRGGYHNREWARMMSKVGLVPSQTGRPGGKQTGDRVSHYIEPDGPFDILCRSYLDHNTTIFYQDRAYIKQHERSENEDKNSGGRRGYSSADERERMRLRRSASKTRFTCMDCQKQTAWAKASARLMCGDCGSRMTPRSDQ